MRTSNVERRTSNVEVKTRHLPPFFTSKFDVQRSTFDVRISAFLAIAVASMSGCCATDRTSPKMPATTQASSAPKHIRIDDQGIDHELEVRVVYLWQASESMLGRFGEAKLRIKESIQNLPAVDDWGFNLISMVDGHSMALFGDGCRLGSESNKKLAFDFIDRAICTGNCNLSSGTEIVSHQHGDFIYLIGNGDFSGESDDKVLHDFEPVIASARYNVNCVFFPSGDDDYKARTLLAKIADAGHGRLIESKTTTKPSGVN